MKWLLAYFLLLISPFAFAQGQTGVSYFTKDSLTYSLTGNWRFQEGDSATWALPGQNDASWPVVDPALHMHRDHKQPYEWFHGICWLRLHFVIDTSLANKAIAFEATQYGASEIYLDGIKLKSYGKIGIKDSCVYFDPQYLPFAFVITSPGEHVLAVRYANYDATRNYNIFHKTFAGFKMKLGFANVLNSIDHSTAIGITTVTIFMFGIFFAMAFIHLLMFLYYRPARSNLFFSIFCFCLSCIFFLPYLNRFALSPAVQLYNSYVSLAITTASCYSLSGFSNFLFSESKTRFRVITAICILLPMLVFFDIIIMAYSFMALIAIVSLETIVLIIRAIYRKVPGAKILSSGILFFALFFLLVTISLIFLGNIQINDDSSIGAKLVELVGILAILSVPISISAYLAWSFSHINKGLQEQLLQVRLLSEKALMHEQEKQLLLENRKYELEREVAARTEEVVAQKKEIEQQHAFLKIEKKKTDDLLLNILPEEIAEELKQKGSSSARFFDQVTVLFTDFVDFTLAGEKMSPQELVDELDACFKAFDEIISRYGIEKIKTIGDAYLAVCGLPIGVEDHAEKIVAAALEIRNFIRSRKETLGEKTFDIRLGVHSGSVVAGIVGVKKFAYDIWGDTVNTAARMEQSSEKGRVNISQVTYELVKDKFTCIPRGEIAAKNKGNLKMYFVEK